MNTPRIPVDVSAWIGAYPFRDIPHPDPEVLVRVLEREGIARAWVGSLPSAWHRDPAPANDALMRALASHRNVLIPSPTVRPGWPGFEDAVRGFAKEEIPAIRCYPMQYGIGANSPWLRELAEVCGAARVVVQLTVRFEDLRQRHPLDTAADLTAAHIRSIVRADPRVYVTVSGAGRDLIEETHWSLTPSEQARLFWDWAWVWGPPEDHFAHLIRSIGADRFVFGGYWPLRLIQAPLATSELLPGDLPAPTFATGDSIVAAARRA
jgi:hypothetical protein